MNLLLRAAVIALKDRFQTLERTSALQQGWDSLNANWKESIAEGFGKCSQGQISDNKTNKWVSAEMRMANSLPN